MAASVRLSGTTGNRRSRPDELADRVGLRPRYPSRLEDVSRPSNCAASSLSSRSSGSGSPCSATRGRYDRRLGRGAWMKVGEAKELVLSLMLAELADSEFDGPRVAGNAGR